MVTLQDAVSDLYRITVMEEMKQSPKRLDALADYCIERLAGHGLSGAVKELAVPGVGRTKMWDVGWPDDGRARLGISLKSLLKNIAGTVPNRVDDMTGEMANVQLQSPEIVTGYIMIFDTGGRLRRDGTRWVDFFRDALERLTGRDAPAWAIGMVEASAIIEVDFSRSPDILQAPDMDRFFETLVGCVRRRNPDRFGERTGS